MDADAQLVRDLHGVRCIVQPPRPRARQERAASRKGCGIKADWQSADPTAEHDTQQRKCCLDLEPRRQRPSRTKCVQSEGSLAEWYFAAVRLASCQTYDIYGNSMTFGVAVKSDLVNHTPGEAAAQAAGRHVGEVRLALAQLPHQPAHCDN